MIGTMKNFIDENILDNLLISNRSLISSVMIEFTNRCNLNCVFCTISHPNYKGMDMEEKTIEEVISLCRELGVKLIVISGHGETTILKNWEEIVNRLLEEGFTLSIISNMTKPLSWEQSVIFSKFSSIFVSIDSLNSNQLKELRRGANSKTILSNITLINTASTLSGNTTKFIINFLLFYENF